MHNAIQRGQDNQRQQSSPGRETYEAKLDTGILWVHANHPGLRGGRPKDFPYFEWIRSAVAPYLKDD
jgi:hypothetical protein